MSGAITKKDFIYVCKYFGLKKGLCLLLSREPVALTVLIKPKKKRIK